MSSGWGQATVDDLGRVLAASGAFVDYPDVPDLAGVVGRTLREAPSPVRRTGRSPLAALRDALRPVARPILQPVWLKAAVAVAVVVAVFSGTLAFSPGARRAVAGWLGLRGVKIVVVPTPSTSLTPPPALGSGLDLGEQVTLAQAQPAVPFAIVVPAALGPPDELYLRTGFIQNQVTLLYRARPGLPEASTTGAGLLLTEFQASIDSTLVEKKVALESTRIEAVTVLGQPGYWIEGAHEVYLVAPDGQIVADSVRLAGNVLLWEHGKVTLRIEADISKVEALRIARSTG